MACPLKTITIANGHKNETYKTHIVHQCEVSALLHQQLACVHVPFWCCQVQSCRPSLAGTWGNSFIINYHHRRVVHPWLLGATHRKEWHNCKWLHWTTIHSSAKRPFFAYVLPRVTKWCETHTLWTQNISIKESVTWLRRIAQCSEQLCKNGDGLL